MSKGRHARKTLGAGTVVAVAAGAVAAPAVIFGTAHHAAPPEVHHADVQLAAAQAPVLVRQSAQAQLTSVTVTAGDTLSGISGVLCGTSADFPELAAGNGITNPDMIMTGQTVRKTCDAYVPKHAAPARIAVSPAPASPARQEAVSTPAAPVGGVYSCGLLEALWERAGGSSALAVTMAGIALAESGGNPGAISPTDDFGLWQDHADPAALSPAVSASASVGIEQAQGLVAWTTYRTGAYAGRC